MVLTGDTEAAALVGCGFVVVGRGGVEPPTFHFSGGRSYQLSYLPSPVSEESCETVRNSTGCPSGRENASGAGRFTHAAR